MLKRSLIRTWQVALFAVLANVSAVALAQSEQQKVLNLADQTFNNFMRDPEMSWLQNHVPQAKGVLIASNVVRAGFIFGGSGGRAVLVVRDPSTGRWNGPAFYTLATASVGFQAGVQVSEIVTLVMTDKGLRSLLATSVKLGADVGIAAGPVGAGANQDLISDLVSFSRSKGVYGGVNLDGTVVTVTDDWNRAFYGKEVQPTDILLAGKVHNKAADKLVADVARATRIRK
jgi:lipid-binding SYLF domain-containing protein